MCEQQPGRFLRKLHSIVFGPSNGRSSQNHSDSAHVVPHTSTDHIEDDCDISHIRLPYLRIVTRQALQYQQQICATVDRPDGVPSCELLQEIVGLVKQCVQRLYQVAVNMDTAIHPAVGNRDDKDGDGSQPMDMSEIAHSNLTASDNYTTVLAEQSSEMGSTADPTSAMGTAAQQLEETLSILGLVYSLILFLDGRDIDPVKAQRLKDSLMNQIAVLDEAQSGLIPTTFLVRS